MLVPQARADSPLDDLPAVRQKLLLHEGRHLLGPTVGMTLNDPYLRNITMGVAWRYYPTSWFGFGAEAAAGVGSETDLAEQINGQLSEVGEPFKLTATSLRVLAHLGVELIPVEGKVMLLGKQLVRISVHVTGGVGFAYVDSDGTRIAPGVSLMPVFGAGLRLFPTSWMCVGLDLWDVVVKRALASDRAGAVPAADYGHNLMTGLSVSFFLPEAPGLRP